MINRRLFLSIIGASALVGTASLGVHFANDQSEKSSFKYSTLPIDQQSLYNKNYATAFDLNKVEFIKILKKKNLILENKLNIAQIQKNASTDKKIAHNDFIYTESELLTYGFIAKLYLLENPKALEQLIKTGSMATLENVDFYGGDLGSFNVGDDSDKCATACETNDKCNAYTYARMEHPNSEKRGICWLKNANFKYKKDGNYISGIKL